MYRMSSYISMCDTTSMVEVNAKKIEIDVREVSLKTLIVRRHERIYTLTQT